jgi:molybdate transport system ATP-binding protein
MIDVDVQKRLGAFSLAVRFSVAAPIVGLFGASGAGKTSVINAIAGISKPDRGSISVDGTVLFDSGRRVDVPPEKRRVGYVFQDALLFPHLDVQRNLLYGQRRCPPADRFIEPSRIIALLGLDALLHRGTTTLSGGERQRVAIGRALLAQPRILLMDEPLVALDAPRKDEVLDYIERLRDDVRIPIVYVSHSRNEIARLADAVVVIAHGQCGAVGNAESILNDPALSSDIDRYDEGSLIEARVAAHDPDELLTTLEFDGGQLVVPLLDALPRDRVRVRVRARDVSLASGRPIGISILNVLPGIVASVGVRTGSSVDVMVAVGNVMLAARITHRSVRDLAIEKGLYVHALVKAVSLDLGAGRDD